MVVLPAGVQDLERPAAERPSGRAAAILRAIGPAVLVAVLIAARNPPAPFRAEFWAEDATEFLFGALELGARSLATPVYGYHFLLERAVAWVASFASVYYAPFVYAWASLLVSAATCAYVTREGFSWIAPARWQRILLAVVLAIGPGTSEAFLNLANLPGPLALLGLLLLIERPFALGWRRMLVLVLIVLSSGQMVLWVPLVAYLAWARRSPAHALLAAVTVAVAVVNLVGSRQAAAESHLLASAGPDLVARIVLENAFLRLVPGPLLGSEVSGRLMLTSPAVFWSAAVVVFALTAAVVVREHRRDPVTTVGLVLAYSGAVGGLAVVALSRSYAIRHLVRESGQLLWDLRYALLPGAVAILAWASWLLRPRASAPGWRVARIVACCAVALNAARHWPSVFPRPDLDWPERASHVQWVLDARERTGKGAIIELRNLAVHPVGWWPNNRKMSVLLPPR